MRHIIPLFALIISVALCTPTFAGAAREYGGRYTAERLANVRANAEKHDWGRALRDEAIRAASVWVKKSDADLWAAVPGQDLPRCIDVTLDRTKSPTRLGCLVCGDKINAFGNYPYDPNFEKKPWKLTCPSCKTVFPTNDFGKYYASGIDEHGLFNPKKADRSLLFNTEHPDPNDPLHTFGVDDGFGYVDKNGREHRFIGYYTWKYWDYIQDGLTRLSNAYLYTGDQRYAHKAAILLDRIADVYPSMDWKPYADRGWFHSDGGSGVGKIQGRIWETGTARAFADAYDKILSGTVGDDALFAFLAQQAQKYKLPTPKGSRDQFVQNVDDNVLRCIYKSILSGQITGNEGMHQKAMASAALALDTQPETTQWLDWLFAPTGGAMPGLIMAQLDRDGVSPEAGPGYALSWGANMADVAHQLAEYPKYTNHDIYKEFPQFRATYLAAYRMLALGKATPNIGDSGSCGSVGAAALSPAFIATGYRFTKDPELAIAAWRANGNSAEGLGRDVFSAQPDELKVEIEKLGKAAGPRPAGSSIMTGYGLALLETGSGASAKALSCYFGRSTHHGHADHLNIDLLAFNNWLLPDHGYPEFATSWPHRSAVTVNSIAHNVVVVDKKPQERGWGGHTRLFQRLPGLTALIVDAREAYPQTKLYSRSLLMVDAPGDNAYVVDVFRVSGGDDHLYSLHGPPGAVTAPLLTLSEQENGTYAGEDVPFASNDSKYPLGYSYFYNVRRDPKPSRAFIVDWKANAGYRNVTDKDDIHVRLHALTPCDDVALADADPPQNKPGNPRRLTYALVHRSGKNLNSTFVSVIEPFNGKPFIRGVQRLADRADSVALKITLADGSIDYVVVGQPGRRQEFEEGLACDGAVGWLRQSGGKPVAAKLIDGTELSQQDMRLTGSPALTGKVVAMNRELGGDGWIRVDAKLPADGSLTGLPIYIDNDNERDACYVIQGVEADGDGSKISCGRTTFVRGYAGKRIEVRGQAVAQSYDRGYLYDFSEGSAFRVPLHAEWKR